MFIVITADRPLRRLHFYTVEQDHDAALLLMNPVRHLSLRPQDQTQAAVISGRRFLPYMKDVQFVLFIYFFFLREERVSVFMQYFC